jgi:isocitrate lyase
MATATPPVSAHVAYPAEAVAKLVAPPEAEQPADKLRRLLHEARAAKSYLHTAGAYDAFTSAIMTRLGFKALYGSGWQLAATKSMFPDIGVYASHDMVKLVHEMWMGVEGARNTHFFDTDGKEVLEVPPAFVDMEAGFGGPTQTFTLAVELIRARAGGVHLENQDPANRTCADLRPHRECGQAEAQQGPGAPEGLARETQGHQGGLTGHRRGCGHHRTNRFH